MVDDEDGSAAEDDYTHNSRLPALDGDADARARFSADEALSDGAGGIAQVGVS